MALRRTSSRSPVPKTLVGLATPTKQRTASVSVSPAQTPPPSPLTPLSLTPTFKRDMCKFLAEEHRNYNATQYTPTDESSAVWSEPLPQFPNWENAFAYDLDAPAEAHAAVKPTSKASAPSPFKALAPQIATSLPETMTSTKPKELHVKKGDFGDLKSLVNTSIVIKVPVDGAFGYDAQTDSDLLPSEQFALRAAAHFLGAKSPATLMAALKSKAALEPSAAAGASPNQRSLFKYLQEVIGSSGEISLHDVVRIISAKTSDFESDGVHVPEQLGEPKLVYLDLSNADAYFTSLRKVHVPEFARAAYREFLAAPLRLKEKWNQTDFVVVPVYQGMNQPRVMGILKTTATGRMKIENSAEFKDLAISALRDYYAAQPVAARREVTGRRAVAELRAEAVDAATEGFDQIDFASDDILGFDAGFVANVELSAVNDHTVKNVTGVTDVEPLNAHFVANTKVAAVSDRTVKNVTGVTDVEPLNAHFVANTKVAAVSDRTVKNVTGVTDVEPLNAHFVANTKVAAVSDRTVKNVTGVTDVEPLNAHFVANTKVAAVSDLTVKNVLEAEPVKRAASPKRATTPRLASSPTSAAASRRVASPSRVAKQATLVVTPRKAYTATPRTSPTPSAKSIEANDILEAFLADMDVLQQPPSRAKSPVSRRSPIAKSQAVVASPLRAEKPKVVFTMNQVGGNKIQSPKKSIFGKVKSAFSSSFKKMESVLWL